MAAMRRGSFLRFFLSKGGGGWTSVVVIRLEWGHDIEGISTPVHLDLKTS